MWSHTPPKCPNDVAALCPNRRIFVVTLSFPNPSRSYDESRRRVRFVGHDGLNQIRFFLPVEILAGDLTSRSPTERDFLSAFDGMRKRIFEIAIKAYEARRRDTIELDPRSFGLPS
jgi:Protein of unknown function (DUF1488)